MKLKTVFAFVTGVSVGSAIMAVGIGKAILKNDICKTALAEIIDRKIDSTLFKNKEPKYKFTKTKCNKVNYSKIFNKPDKATDMKVVPSAHFGSKKEADEVVSTLKYMIETYGFVSVLDYYELVGFEYSEFEDDKFGWSSIDSFRIKKRFFEYPPYESYEVMLPPATRLY